jgi:ABC-type amino acid transport substrate-binding protein
VTRRFVAAFGIAATLVLANVASGADAPSPSPSPPAPAPAPAVPPLRSLVVALGLGSPALQAGVVRGREVILARGYEVALAKLLAKRLGARVERFVHVSSRSRLLAASGASWHVALGSLERQRGGRRSSALSASYLTTDVAIVTRRGLVRPRRLSDLRGAILCAVRGTAGAATIPRLRPTTRPLYVVGPERLRSVVRTGACDAALVPALEVGRFADRQRAGLGPVVGRIRRGDGLGASIPPGTGLRIAAVNRELARLRRDGTLGRLARTWLGLDPAGLPVLR